MRVERKLEYRISLDYDEAVFLRGFLNISRDENSPLNKKEERMREELISLLRQEIK